MSKKELSPKMMTKLAEKLMYQSEDPWAHRDEIFKLLYQAVELGEGKAAYLLGRACQEEELTQRDDEAAKKWFHKAAEMGDGFGWYQISSECYDDEIEELSRLRKSAELGCPDGMTYYGETLDKIHPFKAEEWLKKASNRHEPYANSVLFRHFAYGNRFQDPDYQEAVKYAFKNKKNEYYFSLLQIGIAYDFGIGGIRKNHKKAREWYLKIEREPLAKGYLGRHYIYGLGGLKKDYQKGFELLMEGLKEKPIVPLFLYEVARCYRLGLGVTKNKSKAKEYETLWLIHSSRC